MERTDCNSAEKCSTPLQIGTLTKAAPKPRDFVGATWLFDNRIPLIRPLHNFLLVKCWVKIRGLTRRTIFPRESIGFPDGVQKLFFSI